VVAVRILLLASVHNGLGRRVEAALKATGHDVGVAVVADEAAIERQVPAHAPDLVVCPMLTKRIPTAIWRRWKCLILHPGVVGDQGPSSLDWAVQEGRRTWGVTVVEAAEEFDGGAVWAAERFPLRPVRKTSVYRREVTDAGVRVLLEAVDRFADPSFAPRTCAALGVEPRSRPLMRPADRAIDWERDGTDTVLRKLWAADGRPGVLDALAGAGAHLYGGHREKGLTGRPGALLAHRDGAVCRASADGAVWITHARRPGGLKLPATLSLDTRGIPEALPTTGGSWRELGYREDGPVGYLSFDFYNGAVSTEQALALRVSLRRALRRPTRVLVLLGGADFFCNGIHLAVVEAASDPALESWRNLQALNDVVADVVEASDKLVIAALRGDAAAGGVMLALAGDELLCRAGTMLSPHYQTMGLFGSEYWTYLLPRRVGPGAAAELAGECADLPATEARAAGLADAVLPPDDPGFAAALHERAHALAAPQAWRRRLAAKRAARERDERRCPLIAYRVRELERMRRCLFDPSSHFHRARVAFLTGAPAPPVPQAGPHAVDVSLLKPAAVPAAS
jgi:putative two-component system hydrogenase maturation factor HypX/HoxX